MFTNHLSKMGLVNFSMVTMNFLGEPKNKYHVSQYGWEGGGKLRIFPILKAYTEGRKHLPL